MSKKRRSAYLFLCFFAVFLLLFIFSNSLQSDLLVGQRKGRVMKAVEVVLEWISGRDIVFHSGHRVMFAKIGHVLEYGAFSFVFTLAVSLGQGKLSGESFYRILYCCAVAALADEHLQLLGEGRGPSLTDAILDLSACYAGFGMALVFFSVFSRRHAHASASNPIAAVSSDGGQKE